MNVNINVNTNINMNLDLIVDVTVITHVNQDTTMIMTIALGECTDEQIYN